MSEEEPKPRNRVQRRAAERELRKKANLDESALGIKKEYPDRSGPQGKTLVDIMEEKKAQLSKDHPEILHEDDDAIGPFGEALVYSIALAIFHFTLDVLVFYQYRQDMEWKEIFLRTAKVLPALFAFIYLLRTQTAARFPLLKQLFFFVASVSTGCYLIYSGNKNGYFYVMQTAPALGTLWVWSCVEMQLVFAVLHVVIVVGYTWWNGFTAF